jgi:hypothetical protein
MVHATSLLSAAGVSAQLGASCIVCTPPTGFLIVPCAATGQLGRVGLAVLLGGEAELYLQVMVCGCCRPLTLPHTPSWQSWASMWPGTGATCSRWRALTHPGAWLPAGPCSTGVCGWLASTVPVCCSHLKRTMACCSMHCVAKGAMRALHLQRLNPGDAASSSSSCMLWLLPPHAQLSHPTTAYAQVQIGPSCHPGPHRARLRPTPLLWRPSSAWRAWGGAGGVWRWQHAG